MSISPLINNVSISLCKELGLSLPSKSQTVGRLGELFAYKIFKENNLYCVAKCLTPEYSDFDFFVSNKYKVEVKCAYPNNGIGTFIITKNVGKFDYLLCILLSENPFNVPEFYLIPEVEVKNLTGFRIDKNSDGKFKKYLFDAQLLKS